MIIHDVETENTIVSCDECGETFKYNNKNSLWMLENRLTHKGWMHNIEKKGILKAKIICPMCVDVKIMKGEIVL